MSTPLSILTSISPTRLDEQAKAIDTWKKYNVPISAVQCIGETYALDLISNIFWVDPTTHWSKPTPSIVDIVNYVTGPTLFLNSDIELHSDDLSWWETDSPTLLKIGLRIDYCPAFTQMNKYGIDAFLFYPEMAEHINNPLWALGIPGWDYYVVWKLIECGYRVEILKEGLMHAAHEEQWSHADYRKCAKLLEFEFDLPIQDIADRLQVLTDRMNIVRRKYRAPKENN